MTTLMQAVAAAATGVQRLYATGSVPASPAYPYGSYSASFGRGDGYTLDSRAGLRWGRVAVQCFGRTAESALAVADQVSAALLDKSLNVTGYAASTPLRIEIDPTVPTRDPDDAGVIGTTQTFTFTAIKEA